MSLEDNTAFIIGRQKLKKKKIGKFWQKTKSHREDWQNSNKKKIEFRRIDVKSMTNEKFHSNQIRETSQQHRHFLNNIFDVLFSDQKEFVFDGNQNEIFCHNKNNCVKSSHWRRFYFVMQTVVETLAGTKRKDVGSIAIPHLSQPGMNYVSENTPRKNRTHRLLCHDKDANIFNFNNTQIYKIFSHKHMRILVTGLPFTF